MKTILPRRFFHSLEILESRIAPASLTFLDVDGETVTIQTSKGSLADLTTAAKLTASGMGFQLGELDLRAAVFQGTTVSVLAETGGLGDDKVNVGFLNALGRDLRTVTIGGELDRINAGDARSSTAAIRALTVGGFGGGTAFDSDVVGAINALTVNGDFEGAFLRVRGSDSNNIDPLTIKTDGNGRIGTLTINGSLLGTARNDGGHIETTGNIGTIVVTGVVKGFIDLITPGEAKDGQQFSGRIFAGGKITSLTIGTDAVPGGLIGGDGEKSGQVASAEGLRTATIKGNVTGGAGLDSGALGAAGNLKTVTVTGNLVGGGGTRSGTLLSASSITTATIGGDIIGGEGTNSGAIGTGKQIGTVVVTGDVRGGDGPRSGQIVSEGIINRVTVNNLVGGSDFESGSIGSLKGIGTVLVKGNIVAGSGTRSGIIATEELPPIMEEESIPLVRNAPIGSVTVKGSILGDGNEVRIFESDGPSFGSIGSGAGFRAGSIISSGQLGPVVIEGSVSGGGNSQSGQIFSSKGITSVSIGGELRGGDGDGSGSIRANGAIGPVTIGAKKIAGDRDLIGGFGFASGSISSQGKVTKVDVFGSVLGGDGESSGRISAAELGAVFIAGSVVGSFGEFDAQDSGTIFSSGKIASVTIGDASDTNNETGSLVGGIAFGSGAISSGGDLGPVRIKFNVQGGSGDNSGRIFSGGKIASLRIGNATSVGSLIGGTGDQGANTESGDLTGQVVAVGTIGSVSITGSVRGGLDDFDGEVTTPGGDYTGLIHGKSIASVVIGSALVGGDGILSGGLLAEENIGTVTVSSISGGAGSRSGLIAAKGDLTSVKIKNALVGGDASDSALIAAGGTLGSVEASQVSGGSEGSRPRISAGDLIKKVTISGFASEADILAGYSIFGSAVNPDAQIGTVTIGTPGSNSEESPASYLSGVNIVAGIATGSDGVFGTFDDAVIASTVNSALFSKIASVIINGEIRSSSSSGLSSYGVIAEQLVSVKLAGSNLSLNSGVLNDFYKRFTTSIPIVYGETSLD